ncbi:kinase-like domain-containing protein [Paraphysoderma sedebokerense]|nr:kinase-like domain-containing protein [Paraphysoderma sedebokerense]
MLKSLNTELNDFTACSKVAYGPMEFYYRGTISTATDVFMLATTWLYVDTGTNIDNLVEKNATDTGSDAYSEILTSNPMKYYEGFKLFDTISRNFLSRMMEHEGSKRPEIHEVVDFGRRLWEDSGINKENEKNYELEKQLCDAVSRLHINDHYQTSAHSGANAAGDAVLPASVKNTPNEIVAPRNIVTDYPFETVEDALKPTKRQLSKITNDQSYVTFNDSFQPDGEVLSTRVLPYIDERIPYRWVQRYKRSVDQSQVLIVSVDFNAFDEIADNTPRRERRILKDFRGWYSNDAERELRFALLLLNSPADIRGLLKPLDIISDTGHSFRMTSKSYKIIYPYANTGSLYDYLQKGNHLSEEEFHTFMMDTALGVQYLNSHSMVSGTLTPHHLFGFTDGDGKLRWRLGDWERVWYNNTRFTTDRGRWSTAFAAPEFHDHFIYAIPMAVDIFMLATTWLYVDSGSNLDDLAKWNGEPKEKISRTYHRIFQGDTLSFYKGFKFFNSNSRKFLARMLDIDGSKRPEIEEVLDFCKDLPKLQTDETDPAGDEAQPGPVPETTQDEEIQGESDAAIAKLEISNPAQLATQDTADTAWEDVRPATAESATSERATGVDLFETIENVLESAKPHRLLVPETRLLHKRLQLFFD